MFPVCFLFVYLGTIYITNIACSLYTIERPDVMRSRYHRSFERQMLHSDDLWPVPIRGVVNYLDDEDDGIIDRRTSA